jgi:hypothetical protein
MMASLPALRGTSGRTPGEQEGDLNLIRSVGVLLMNGFATRLASHSSDYSRI